MVDLLAGEPVTPHQPPTLTELEAIRLDAATARRVSVEWLMATDAAPNLEELLGELVSRPEWHRRAACRGADPDLFFPERGDRGFATALAYCAGCAVRTECLDSAWRSEQRRPCGGRNDGTGSPGAYGVGFVGAVNALSTQLRKACPHVTQRHQT